MIKNNNQKLVKNIYNKIIKHKYVSIFPHYNPDNDAYGACLAMALFLKKKGIDARIAGLDCISNKAVLNEVNNTIKNVTDDFAKKSIGIILDTGASKKIVTEQFKLCKDLVRIDHHPKSETICKSEWVDTEYCSTCEMVGWFILFNDKKSLTKEIANALYVGILTDSGNLMFPSATASVFMLIANFFDVKFDKQKKQDELFLKQWSDATIDNKIRKKVVFDNQGFAYLILKPKDFKKYNLTNAESKVYLMSGFKDIKIWFSVYYDLNKKNWRCSIRSREFPVRDIAIKYNGGGHILASGFILPSLKELDNLINEVKLLLNKSK